jgi:hypothetical protein
MNMQTTLGAVPTFTLEEAAEICQVKAQILRNWVAAGDITPALPGGKGRGKVHRFSGQQLLGIAAVGAMYAHRWTSRTQADAVLQMFSDMPDSALLHWLGVVQDARTEEADAAFASHPLFLDHGSAGNGVGPDEGGRLRSPLLETVQAEVTRRMERAEKAIRRRMRGQRDRFDGRK